MKIHATTWRPSIEWDPPSAHLVLKSAGEAPTWNVTVFLDGMPAEDQPTVYLVREAASSGGTGSEVRISFIPIGGRPQFKRIEVRWEDDGGALQTFATEI